MSLTQTNVKPKSHVWRLSRSNKLYTLCTQNFWIHRVKQDHSIVSEKRLLCGLPVSLASSKRGIARWNCFPLGWLCFSKHSFNWLQLIIGEAMTNYFRNVLQTQREVTIVSPVRRQRQVHVCNGLYKARATLILR